MFAFIASEPLRRRGRLSLRRSGIAWKGVLIALSVLGIASLTGWWLTPATVFSKQFDRPMMHNVERTAFIHEVTERGDVESSSTVDLRCEVQSRNSSGTAILEIVPEGTKVKTGDVLCKLDSSALEGERNQQQILCNNSSAALIQTRNVFETAIIARQEYLEGTYKQEEQLIQGEIFVAEQTLRTAQSYADYSKGLAAKNYVTPTSLAADLFAVEKARKDLDVARTKLSVLQNFTKAKMLKQLDADIKTAEANLKSQENSHRIDQDKLSLIIDQIEKCTIKAPQDGEVTYFMSSDRDSNDVVIKEGAVIRERQSIIRLPNPKMMQVNAKVNESKIRLIRIGMPATIRVEALDGVVLTGNVVKVMAYANRSRYSSSSIKEFSVIVKIDDPPADLRTGSSAEVKVRVNQSADEVQVPVQAVIEHGSQQYCLFCTPDGKWSAKPVKVGPTNDSNVVIREGLSAKDEVVLNPRPYLKLVNLPELPARVITANELLAGKQPLTSAPADVPGGGLPAVAGGPGGGSPSSPADRLARMDKDGDGKVSQDEAPEPMRAGFAASDKNGDGFLDPGELAAMSSGRGRRGAGGGGGPGGPGGANAAGNGGPAALGGAGG